MSLGRRETQRPIDATRNRWSFALGTLGRDMAYTLVTMFLLVYLTEVVDLDDTTMWSITGLMLGARLIDAITDLLMGVVVDNTHTRWGQFKPWIAAGALSSAVLTVLLFVAPAARGPHVVAGFAVIYLLWGLSYTVNDIPYWSLLPTLSFDPRERERISSHTKIIATLGVFTTVIAVLPVTSALGGDTRAWTLFAAAVALVLVAGQSVTLFGLREPGLAPPSDRTPLRAVLALVLRNDQLVWTALALALFMTGFSTTTAFGVYYFKYVYGDEAMYTPFAAVLGVGQLIGYATFGLLRRRLDRRRMFALAVATLTVGYVAFWVAPRQMAWLAVAGLAIFVSQAWVTVLMLAFLSDCIEYGQWKSGRRNGSATFSVQPFVYKVSGAASSAIAGVTLIVTGINSAPSADAVSPAGITGLKAVMLAVPLAMMLLGYALHQRRFTLDEARHEHIVSELRAQGDIPTQDDAGR
ncbi:glycoside-pentoside-hexuronide (GPH):cation symporter [Nigerium massiliense]|uniref:glycoside-pentoside-hexuronide (GPH):cation symporter n=1 Tax=Nigerium massiliense TaxID=1522317 RepID=UPI0006941BF9|nr:glycoside-pentoside-hexuronide (GPH):cation symporter [Nigerium massiliense]